ncbi:MAG: NAD(+) synthase [Deltaproteobacteria bacterium]|nr:NAD(+) synthase [Deltaproteobacteria bacterium]
MRGFTRVSVAVPVVKVADAASNARATAELWQKAHDDGAALVVFPELGLTSYTARDLFFDNTLLQAAETALSSLLEASRKLAPLAVVGMPLRTPQGLYNVAVVLQAGRLLGAIPKSYLPNYREFEEKRWFRPGTEIPAGSSCRLLGQEIPFGTDLLFDAGSDVVVGVEVCEDYWVQVPPSAKMVGQGATIIANLSASNFTIGKADLRRLLAESQSDRGKCAYLYVAAGPGESSTDLAFDADAFVCENGSLIAESRRFARESQLVTVDVDVELLVRERMVTSSFGDCAKENPLVVRRIPFTLPSSSSSSGLKREVTPHPFIPKNPATLATRLWEIFEIQTNALATRLQALTTSTWKPKLVLGISGGLDSTQAALVAATALDLCGRPRSDLIAVTMPGLGTSASTKDNALTLATSLGAVVSTVSIAEMSRVVLGATGHAAAKDASTVEELIDRVRADKRLGDPTLENVQARLRTLVLMTLANQHGGLVVGTGDLSEKALGWCTYSGDHISMYDVNAGVPKTLIQFVIRWVANERVTTWDTSKGDASKLRETLFSILDTPISPELLPTDKDGKIAHLTEAAIGPYELHDFYLFHFVRHGRTPTRILDLARVAFKDRYTMEVQKKWLRVFLTRFFSNQFKRSCTADAPKVGMVALSPRGDWRMPSDAVVTAWVEQVDAWQPEA